jgi:glyoxylase-like metal-dependent hydrolase (beta-lactamase superfamily II)
MARLAGLALAAGVFLVAVFAAPDDRLPKMKFNDVREIAPGVFFRYSSISATDMSIPFGGSNHAWVVFKDYVVVIDANFPKEAGDVIQAIRKTTDKPIRYVLDTHHHGDHAYGNAVWAKEGAKIVGQTFCARTLKTKGPSQWADAAKGRKDIAESELKQVDINFDEEYVLKDETQEVIFRHLGHSHTAGDAVAYLPKHKILCTGDACVNGAFNYMGHSNSASWIRCLEKMQAMDVKIVFPGHGHITGPQLLETQKRYFVELRKLVKDGIDAGKKLDEIIASADLPWYKEWTGKAVKENRDNIKHVYDEFMGKIEHDKLGRANDAAPWPYGAGLRLPPDSAIGR